MRWERFKGMDIIKDKMRIVKGSIGKKKKKEEKDSFFENNF